MDLIRIEFTKIVKRKDFLLLLSMIFLPMLYAIGLSTKSSSVTYEGAGKITGLYYASQMYGFVYMLFVYYVILAVCVIRSLKGEIEAGSIQLYVQRINNRKKIFSAKMFAYLGTIIGITLLFVLFSMLCFMPLILKRPDITQATIIDMTTAGNSVAVIIGILLSFIFTICYSMFLSAYRKSFEAMGLFIFTWIAFMYLKQLSGIKYFIPIYYVETLLDEGSYQWADVGILLLVVTIYSSACIFLGMRKFVKSDLA